MKAKALALCDVSDEAKTTPRHTNTGLTASCKRGDDSRAKESP